MEGTWVSPLVPEILSAGVPRLPLTSSGPLCQYRAKLSVLYCWSVLLPHTLRRAPWIPQHMLLLCGAERSAAESDKTGSKSLSLCVTLEELLLFSVLSFLMCNQG